MPTLDPALRDQLAAVIGTANADSGARIAAEAGAKAAIEALAVHRSAPYDHLDVGHKQLRNRLRARARQLGDKRHNDGKHEIGRLVEQTAYEHWHRMLFARFLAENDLLIHPEMGVAVTLEECAELAADEGAVDGWELAGRYASRMLPQIFRPDDPLLALRFAIDDVKRLEALLDSLPAEQFQASDSLGWCYQFWQARKKKEVNASEVKIGADELPAVTQLFTEPYMVQFLLHNTLGAWWVGLGRTLPMEMPYLRLLDDGRPATGTFEGWPRLAREIKVLDPCCGSGHFLVAAFEILVDFRMAEGGLDAREACDAVLRDNLYGLEIDERCVQIAAFALALAAWTFPGAGGYRPLASMNVACSGLSVRAKRADWESLGGENLRLRAGMRRIWEIFRDAPVLGSLIDPNLRPEDALYTASFEELEPQLSKALDGASATISADEIEARVTAKGLASAARLLSDQYTLVVTNPPYLLRGKQSDTIRDWCESYCEDGKGDVATVFIERFRAFCLPGGSHASVTPQNWLFLGSFKDLRKRLLRESILIHATKVGSGERAVASWDVIRALTIFTNGQRTNYRITGLEASDPYEEERARHLREGPMLESDKATQLRVPDNRIVLGWDASGPTLSDFADSVQGISSADLNRFGRFFWELPQLTDEWRRWQSSVGETAYYAGRELVLWFGRGLQEAVDAGKAFIRGESSWGKPSIVVSAMGRFPCTIGTGEASDTNVALLVPKNERHLAAIWTYCVSGEFTDHVRAIDKALKVTNGTFLKVPFDVERWERQARDLLPNGLHVPNSPDPTQWIYSGPLRLSQQPLQVAVSRLLGYQWPDQDPDGLEVLADDDGIVCVPALRGERPAADRLRDLLAAGWGNDWHPQMLTDLLAQVGHKGSLEEWLRDKFFEQHFDLFKQRPFIWHIWDGHRDGFSALVNCHKLDHEGLKSLTYSYLGDWIRTQELEAKKGTSGAGDKLAKAKALQQRLAAILEGEAPLDIFIRWKSIDQQPIGWHPDLDDGVRLNIRPFMTVADVGRKGAGVLRLKPRVKWGKDRGKNPPGSPWGEGRHNDKHLSLAEKRAARGQS